MTMLRLFIRDWQQLRHDAGAQPRARDAARLHRKLWRKEIGLGVVVLGAAVMFVDAARGLSGLAG